MPTTSQNAPRGNIRTVLLVLCVAVALYVIPTVLPASITGNLGAINARARFAVLPFGLKAAICFLATWLIDVCYALYTLRTIAHRPASAATYGVMVYLLGAINAIGYFDDIRLLVPVMLGGWLGTYAMVWREAHQAGVARDAAASARAPLPAPVIVPEARVSIGLVRQDGSRSPAPSF